MSINLGDGSSHGEAPEWYRDNLPQLSGLLHSSRGEGGVVAGLFPRIEWVMTRRLQIREARGVRAANWFHKRAEIQQNLLGIRRLKHAKQGSRPRRAQSEPFKEWSGGEGAGGTESLTLLRVEREHLKKMDRFSKGFDYVYKALIL